MEGSQGAGTPGSGFLAELRTPYRPGQGILTRRIAYWSGLGLVIWGSKDLWVWLQGFGTLQRPLVEKLVMEFDLSHLPLGGPALSGSVLVAAGIGVAAWAWVAWFLKRPWLADLLIETEAEMKKVSWPAGGEAWSATLVVAVTVLVFTAVLTIFDFAITGLMKLLTGLPL